MGASPAAWRAFPPHWAGLDTWPRLGKPNQGKQWTVPGASRGEGSVQKASTELGTALQPRGEQGAALGAGLCPQLCYFSAQWALRGDGDTKPHPHPPASTSPAHDPAKLQECPKPPTHTKTGNSGHHGDILPQNHHVPELV